MPIVFITGPVRSGKSRFAERLAVERGEPVTYVATARVDATDAEWCARIAHHAARRPPAWDLVETERDGSPSLVELARSAEAGRTLLVDSFGTWLAARMGPSTREADLSTAASEAADALIATRAHAIVVGDEAGWGLVPPYPSGRLFRDVLGRAQQRLAGGSAIAYLTVAGFAIDLRRTGFAIDV